MTRQDPDPTPLVTLNTDGDILDASDFNFGWTGGVEGRVGYMTCRIGFEIGGFWLRPWTAFHEADEDLDDLFIETDPDTIINTPTSVTGYNETRLWGLDANVVMQMNPSVQVFAGVAFMQLADTLEIEVLDDQVTTTTNPDEGYGLYTWDTLNRMVGPQFGFRANLGPTTPGSFFISVDVRGGVLFNWIQNSLFADRVDGLGDLTGTDTAFSVVPMVGAGVNLNFQATANIAFTAGYQALWLGNVALAPDQVGETGDMNVGGPGVVPLGTATNDFLAHGLEIGVKLTF